MEPVIQLQIHAMRAALQRSLETATNNVVKSQPSTLPWSPGDRIAATVEATRGDGRMLLRIGDFVFDAPKPAGVEVNQQLTLRFLSGGDKPTFALESAAASASEPAADVEISASARKLDNVIRTVSGDSPRSAGTIEEPVPLLAAAAGDAKEIASALQKSVSGSGMFYESHVRKWAEGEWPLNRLLHEPQARAAADGSRSSIDARSAHVANDATASEYVDERAPSAVVGDRATIASATFPQIRNQLEFLDTGHLVWQGQLWPGQPMRMEIDQPPESATPEEQPQWTSRLHVEMPSLGGVSAELVLTGATLRINLRADTPLGRDTLVRNRSTLQESMRNAGLDLHGVQISDGN